MPGLGQDRENGHFVEMAIFPVLGESDPFVVLILHAWCWDSKINIYIFNAYVGIIAFLMGAYLIFVI